MASRLGGFYANIRIELSGHRKALAELKETGRQVGILGQQVDHAEKSMARARRRTFLMNQALFTLRRFSFYATIGLGALAGAAVKMGLAFNMSMEQNQIAMKLFLGSEKAATAELDYLYQLAAKTPFEFEQVVAAERRFLAFGFSVKEAREALSVIGDVAAGLGGDPASNIERLVLVLGQVRATGRVLGQDMLQLQQLGINTNRIFQEELGITQDQLKNGIGELQISSEVAIPALIRGMDKQFHGMAVEQSKTLTGMITTLHDYTAQLMGALTMPVFDRLRTALVPGLVDLAKTLQVAADEGKSFHDMIGIIDRRLGAKGGLVELFDLLFYTTKGVVNIFRNVLIPAFLVVALILSKTVLPPLVMLAKGFEFITRYSKILVPLMTALTTAFLIHAAAIFLNYTYMRLMRWAYMLWAVLVDGRLVKGVLPRFLLMMRAITVSLIQGTVGTYLVAAAHVFWMNVVAMGNRVLAFLMFELTMLKLLLRKYVIQLWLAIVAGWRWVASMTAATVAAARLRIATIVTTAAIWLMNTALYANPFVWVAVAVIALVAALALLYWKFERLRPAIHALVFVLFGPLIGTILLVIKYWREIGAAIDWVWNKLRGFVEWASGKFGFLGNIFSFAQRAGGLVGAARGFVGLQHGGAVTSGGAFVVGERGPELAMLPRGAAVTPSRKGGGAAALPSFPEYIQVPVTVEINGKEIAKANAQYRMKKRARA